MGNLRESPEVTLDNVVKGVEQQFDPFHIQKVDYRIEENTVMSVNLVIEEEWETPSKYPKWEKIDYVLRLQDFIETLGYGVNCDTWIRAPQRRGGTW